MGLSLKKLGSKIFDQVNPLDNGRTYQQRTPTNNRSAIGQATHNGVTNVVGASAVKPLIRSSMALNQGIGNLELKLGGRQTQNAKQYSAGISPNFQQFTDYKGTKNQIGGDLITTAANVAMPGTSNVVKNAFRAVAPKVVPDIALRTVANSGVGAVGGAVNNVGAGLSDNQIHSFNDLKDKALTGAKFGAVLGAGGTLATPVVKAGASKAISAKPVIKPLNEGGKPVNAEMGNRVERGKQLQQQWDKGSGAVRKTIAKEIAKNNQAIAKLDEVGGGAIENSPIRKLLQGEGKAPKAPEPVQNPVVPSPKNSIDDQLQKEVLGDVGDVNYNQRALGTLSETYSPNKLIRKGTQAVEGVANKVLRKSLESGNTVTRTPGRTVAGISRQAGRTPEELAQYGRLQGGKQVGDELGLKIAQSGDEAVKRGVNPVAVAEALDPKLTKARGGKAPTLTAADVAEVARLRKIIDLTHEGSHQIGLLDDKAYQANKGTYFPRNFDAFFEDDVTRQIAKNNKLDLNIFKQRKDLADIPKEVLEKANRDPYYMTALRVQQYTKNKAVIDHTKWLAEAGGVLDTPKAGYVQVPDSPAYGAIKGKYVLKEQLEDLQGFIYETDTAQHVVALLNTFDRNPARQFLKKTKTVYNPGVRIGNRTFNYLTATLNGINPITYTRNWARARQMMSNKSPEFLEATKAGVFGSSIIDKELYQVGDALTPVKGNIATKGARTADNAVTNTYRGVDDKGKMATYLTFRERGLSPADAAERTRRAMQNYDMVGHFFDLGAKTPIGGNAFVRFSSELMRIAHNSAVDNPLRLASAVAAVVALTNLASQASGESPEDRKTREGRLGAPRVPFTNQSLEIQSPWGAINVGRLLGITTYNDANGGVAEDSKRLLPFQPPVTNTENGIKFNPNFLTADPLVGPMLGQAIDKDFRGKSIKDPENSGQFLDQLSTKDQLTNRAKTAAMSYVPLANEANSAYSALRGQENFYGKKRSPAQAGLRIAGIKVEQYGPEQAKKQRGTDEYFKDKAVIDKEVATLPKKDQEAYKQATGYYKLREQVPNEFSPGDTRYKKAPVYNFSENKWGEYAASPKLYDLIKKDKERKAKKGQPLQPEFDNQLSSEFRKQLISNKALAPGEDIEADQRLYSSSEWETYNQLKEKYKAEAKKYYPDRGDGDFTDEMVKHQNAPFPTKGAAKKAYDDAYKLYAKGQGPKPQYNDQVNAEKEAYSTAQFNWTNTERKARGLPPISKEMWDNVTFGYESDEEKVYKQLKYGKGYGGYGSGGGGSGSSDPYKYAVSLNQGSVGKPKAFKVSKGSKKIAKAKIKKPKVSIKKSLV